MATFLRGYFFILILVLGHNLSATERAGFFLPEDVPEVVLRYKTVDGLVILPVVINDTVRVNLILDTGCRNLVLFGKKFQKLFKTEQDKKVQFSGLGAGDAITGELSLNNKVSIEAVIGENIPLVVVSKQNVFAAYPNIHGVIGYDIFVKFEIELNPRKHVITFRPAANAMLGEEFQKIPIRIEDSRPIISSQIFFAGNHPESCDLMIDTGSSLGLLVKTSDLKRISKRSAKMKLGRGFNGPVMGITMTAEKLLLDTFEVSALNASITYSDWQNHASVGMDIMKNFIVVLNYCQGYAGLRKVL